MLIKKCKFLYLYDCFLCVIFSIYQTSILNVKNYWGVPWNLHVCMHLCLFTCFHLCCFKYLAHYYLRFTENSLATLFKQIPCCLKNLVSSTFKVSVYNKWYLSCTLNTIIKLYHKMHCWKISLDKQLDTGTCAGFGCQYLGALIYTSRYSTFWGRCPFLSLSNAIIVILFYLLISRYVKINSFSTNISYLKMEVSIILYPDVKIMSS